MLSNRVWIPFPSETLGCAHSRLQNTTGTNKRRIPAFAHVDCLAQLERNLHLMHDRFPGLAASEITGTRVFRDGAGRGPRFYRVPRDTTIIPGKARITAKSSMA